MDAGIRSPGTPNTSTIEGTDSNSPRGAQAKKGKAATAPTMPSARRHRTERLRVTSMPPAGGRSARVGRRPRPAGG